MHYLPTYLPTYFLDLTFFDFSCSKKCLFWIFGRKVYIYHLLDGTWIPAAAAAAGGTPT